jgi:hypothetical protein
MWKRCISVGAVGAVAGIACAGWTPVSSAATGDVTVRLAAPIVGIASTPTGGGYWEVAADGGIFAFGDAGYYGSMGGHHLAAPIVGIAAAPTGHGYWEVAADGGIFAFGSAGFHGSMGGKPLNAPVVGMAAAPTGRGYWEVASDGGIFAFGTAGYHGSRGGTHLNKPVVGMGAARTGGGYWEVASDGGIFAFGTAGFHGSMGGARLAKPIVGMAPAPTSAGYWEVASDGGVFAFGNAKFEGSMSGKPIGPQIVGMTPNASSSGYWEVGAAGSVYTLGSAKFDGAVISAPATHAAQIVSIANGQAGKTNPYAYGPSSTNWCGYFTSWVWRSAGIPIPALGPAAYIGTWALQHGGALLPPGTRPAPGDAVLWVRAYTPHVWPDAAALNYPNIAHVNIVTQVLSNGEIVTVGGNESGAVRRIGPYSPAGASAYFGQAIYGFVRPPA